MTPGRSRPYFIASAVCFGLSALGYVAYPVAKNPVDEIILVATIVLLPAETSWALLGFSYRLREAHSSLIRFSGILLGVVGLCVNGLVLPVLFFYQREYLRHYDFLRPRAGDSWLWLVVLLEGLAFGYMFAKSLIPPHVWKAILGNIETGDPGKKSPADQALK